MLTLETGARTGAALAPHLAKPAFLRKGAHIPALDALRGIAVLLVIVYHADQNATDPSRLGRALHTLLHVGSCGVDLFFVLSGYLITGILYDAKGETRYFRNFYVRRTLRIFPLYYGVLVLAFVLVPLVTDQGGAILFHAERYQAWLWLYGANVLIALKSCYIVGAFSHFWSLAVEEHFYLFWPFVIYACNRKQGMAVCLACLAGAPLCRAWLMWGGGHDVAAYVLTPCRLDGLAAGAWLALALRGPFGRVNLLRWAVASFIACAAATSVLFAGKLGLPKMDGTGLVVRFSLSSWLFASLLLLALASTQRGAGGAVWNSRGLRFFGKYSYGLYVFHYPILLLMQYGLSVEDRIAAWVGTFAARLAFVALTIGASVVAALLSWNLYEKHFLKLKDVWAGKGAAVASS